MRIVLASASPRRRELLGVMGLKDFEVFAAPGDEPDFSGLPPRERVERIALSKARRTAAALEKEGGEEPLVLAADTLVFLGDEALGKPRDEADAERMLRLLSGRVHQVATGVAVLYRGQERLEAEVTRVRFAELTEREIRAYAATGEPMDKAGGYGIQGRGSVLIRGIDGDYFNVMGLPIRKVYEMLLSFGVRTLG